MSLNRKLLNRGWGASKTVRPTSRRNRCAVGSLSSLRPSPKEAELQLHEYEAKRLHAHDGISVPLGDVATTPEEGRWVAVQVGQRVSIRSQVLDGVAAVQVASAYHATLMRRRRPRRRSWA
jgi:hypothetical protein